MKDVRGGVVVPEDLQRGLFYAPYGHVGEKWEQVAWSSTWVLADETGWVRTRRVEVPQAESSPPRFRCDNSASRLNMTRKGAHTLCEILDNRLAHYLTLAVWTIRLESRCFWDWHNWRGTIHGRGGRVDESGAVKFGHNLKEVYCCGDIVVVIRHWDLG